MLPSAGKTTTWVSCRLCELLFSLLPRPETAVRRARVGKWIGGAAETKQITSGAFSNTKAVRNEESWSRKEEIGAQDLQRTSSSTWEEDDVRSGPVCWKKRKNPLINGLRGFLWAGDGTIGSFLTKVKRWKYRGLSGRFLQGPANPPPHSFTHGWLRAIDYILLHKNQAWMNSNKSYQL